MIMLENPVSTNDQYALITDKWFLATNLEHNADPPDSLVQMPFFGVGPAAGGLREAV